MARAELQRIIEARAGTAVDHYDLISGLAGTARYLLERSAEDPESKAPCEAVAIRGGDVKGVIFHSDRGSEYTADLYQSLCARLGIIPTAPRQTLIAHAAASSYRRPHPSGHQQDFILRRSCTARERPGG